MLKTKQELKIYLELEKKLYLGRENSLLRLRLLADHDYLLWRYVTALRYTEYHYNVGHRFRYLFWQRNKNRRGVRLGITIWHNTVKEGLRLWHYGSIIINGYAKIGKNCQFHGENCVGNKGDWDQEAPVIGNNVDIGIGAKIIGGIYIADDVKIGANAVVTKSCYEKGAVLIGVPAHRKRAYETSKRADEHL